MHKDDYYISFAFKRIAYAKWGLKEWKRRVPAYVRNYLFFIPGIDDKELLSNMFEITKNSIKIGGSVSSFIDESLIMLDDYLKKKDSECAKILYDIERLRSIYLTNWELDDGHRLFVEAFTPYQLRAYPAWEFHRQAGAINNKRKIHIDNEKVVKLKTDLSFWLSMNDEKFGGFGNPFGPFGFNSWMRQLSVNRDKAIELGLIEPKQKIDITAAEREQWCLPLLSRDDLNDAGRLQVQAELKRWHVWNVRKKILERQMNV